jgi:hypothetical protein
MTCEPLSGVYPGDVWPAWIVQRLGLAFPPFVPIEDLVLDGGNVRRSDPDTSHEAAADQTPRKNGPLHAAVLLFLYWQGRRTDEEISDALGGPESSPRKRRGELQAAGLIEDTGARGTSRFGKPMIVWRLSDTGEGFVRSNLRELVELRDRRKLR